MGPSFLPFSASHTDLSAARVQTRRMWPRGAIAIFIRRESNPNSIHKEAQVISHLHLYIGPRNQLPFRCPARCCLTAHALVPPSPEVPRRRPASAPLAPYPSLSLARSFPRHDSLTPSCRCTAAGTAWSWSHPRALALRAAQTSSAPAKLAIYLHRAGQQASPFTPPPIPSSFEESLKTGGRETA
jgi:hypothetical protein